jgi:hypothetical protein
MNDPVNGHADFIVLGAVSMRDILQTLVEKCELGVKLDGWRWQFIASGPLPVILLVIFLIWLLSNGHVGPAR